MIARWYELSVLPPKMPNAGKDDELGFGLWTPGRHEKERALAQKWYSRMKAAQVGRSFRVLSEAEAQPYRTITNASSMPVLIGPADSQSELHLKSGDAVTLSSTGAPENDKAASGRANAGWLLDIGGVVPSLAWKPAEGDGGTEQILAMAVVSHVDQSVAQYQKESHNPEFQQNGTIHIWSFTGEATEQGYVRASKDQARRLRTLCLNRGRAKRVQWSPTCGLLAIICGDGSVFIVEPQEGGSGDFGRCSEICGQLTLELTMRAEMVEHPIAVLDLGGESTKATAMTWNNCNRLSVGYTDGSIALWSIFPPRLLSRHPIHHNHVLDMACAYPTFPYLVSSSPVGGPPKLIDLRSPSYETTESVTASVQTSAGLISYSEHLLGFFFPLPSSNALSTVVGFAHHAYYPVSRRICTPDSFVTCISAGRTHPYLLIGTLDGSLWSLNPQGELFAVRYEVSDRIRVFQHEHRSAELYEKGTPGSERGASRILQGFKKEKNPNPRNDVAAAKKTAKKGKGKAATTSAGPETSKEVINESLTRLTAVQWNPNQGYGCWAAAAMASGLVRIMDLGLEPESSAG
jgi:transcription factor C subunit 6